MTVDPVEAIIYYVVFLFSTTLHEAAHAWAAARGGDLTAYHGGQVSLDPLPHIRREPFGMVVLPILSVIATGWPLGFASAPYDPEWARRFPRRAAWMSLAGPAANLLLVLAAGLLIRLGDLAGVFFAPDAVRFEQLAGTTEGAWWSAVALVLSVMFSLNVILATFNLLPLPPLDGSGAVPLLLGAESTRKYQDIIWGNPALAIVGMLIAWRVYGAIYDPIFTGAVNLLYPEMSYR
jgi:Zn-dependent protease